MSRFHCVFCLKPAPGPSPSPTKSSASSLSATVAVASRSLNLLGRYAQLEPWGWRRRNFSVCGGCNPTLESFSNLYGQLKELELRVEWELAKLAKVVEYANRVPVRGAFVKQCYYEGEKEGEEEEKGMMEEMYTWRRTLSKRSELKRSKSFPKVCMVKLAPAATNQNQPTTKRDIDVKQETGGEEEEAEADATMIDATVTVKLEVDPDHLSQTDVEERVVMMIGGEGDTNLNQVEMEHRIDIKYEISTSPRPHSPEPDLDSVDGSLAHSPSPSSAVQSQDNVAVVPPKAVPSTTAPAHKWCAICSILFPTGYHFRRHYKRAHDFKRAGLLDESAAARCSQCPAYFVSSRTLSFHVTQFHQQTTTTQVKSEEDSSRAGRNSGGGGGAGGGKRFQCSQCPKWFLQKHCLAKHVQSNHDLTGISSEADVSVCKVSGCSSAYFRTAAQLHKHRLEFHAGDLKKSLTGKPCICVECGKPFTTKYKLLLHRRWEHQAGKKEKLVCGTCETSFTNRSTLIRHCKKFHAHQT